MAHHEHSFIWLGQVVLVAALAGSGCSVAKGMFGGGGGSKGSAAAAIATGAAAATAAAGAPLGDATPGISKATHVRFKRVRLLKNDFATALQLSPDQLCSEDGHDCVDNYTVALGGHDLALTIFSSPENPIVTTPIAVERIALQACMKRIDADMSGTPVVFKGVKAADTSYTPAMAAAGVQLYHGFVRRDPTSAESDALQQIFTKAQASAPAGTAGKVWAQLACWSVATTLESVLY